MKRIHRLAADIHGYSYENYIDHLGVNPRFDRYMPERARTLEKALREEWAPEKVASAIGVPVEDVPEWLDGARTALDMVDADNPVEYFRRAVRDCVKVALKEGLKTDEDIDNLVRQICYRASDLSVVLDDYGHSLRQHSEELRREPDVDYWDGSDAEPD